MDIGPVFRHHQTDPPCTEAEKSYIPKNSEVPPLSASPESLSPVLMQTHTHIGPFLSTQEKGTVRSVFEYLRFPHGHRQLPDKRNTATHQNIPVSPLQHPTDSALLTHGPAGEIPAAALLRQSAGISPKNLPEVH